jgi:preprotein translocase subunit SecE
MANSKVVTYFKESYDELMHKVSWPSWSELQGSAIVVSIASLIIALVVFCIDEVFQNVLMQFYKLF